MPGQKIEFEFPSIVAVDVPVTGRGKVFDPFGVPVPSAHLKVNMDGKHRFYVVADENGEYLFTLVAREEDRGTHKILMISDKVRSDEITMEVI